MSTREFKTVFDIMLDCNIECAKDPVFIAFLKHLCNEVKTRGEQERLRFVDDLTNITCRFINDVFEFKSKSCIEITHLQEDNNRLKAILSEKCSILEKYTRETPVLQEELQRKNKLIEDYTALIRTLEERITHCQTQVEHAVTHRNNINVWFNQMKENFKRFEQDYYRSQ